MAARARRSGSPAASGRGCKTAEMEEIFQNGLHEFIQEFIADNNRIGGDHHPAISGVTGRPGTGILPTAFAR